MRTQIKIIACFVFWGTFLLNSKVAAQAKIGVNFQAVIPTDEFSDVASTGYGIILNPMFFLGPNVALGFSGGYQHYTEEVSGLRYSVVPLTFDGEYYFVQKGIRPYLGISGGAFVVSTKLSSASNSSDVSSEGYFGIAPKGGVFLDFAGEWGINLGAKYQLIFLDETTWSAFTPELGFYILIR